MTKSNRYYPDPPMEKDDVRGKAKELAEEDTDEEDDHSLDDGSAINVCPLKILPKLGISMSELTGSDLVIRAYDDSKRNVIGVFKTMAKVRPVETEVEFTVLDIPMTFSLLLGRIWFHPLGEVPSTLH
ncbi:hypothetical protein GH714_017304 [Hevea brasiliensis]|uniref:Uncharacterized protein n=1 Tax=Hevea brasiliensis TaxID=3981 RepID=A0A6A6NI06_HEVBR|nr:hypothetical protein GH714_017304 [Hevea brasiliensis]